MSILLREGSFKKYIYIFVPVFQQGGGGGGLTKSQQIYPSDRDKLSKPQNKVYITE